MSELWRRTEMAGGSTCYDHRIDELWWPDNVFWVERGVLGRQYLPKGGKLLDVCCGDGYISDAFFSCTAGHIDAVDRNEAALDLAKTEHGRSNIRHIKMDIVKDSFPDNGYDLACLFEAIEHLSAQAGQDVLRKIKTVLNEGGHLVGCTTKIGPDQRGQGNIEHDNEFGDLETLREFVGAVFQDTRVFATYHPRRTTLYWVSQKRS